MEKRGKQGALFPCAATLTALQESQTQEIPTDDLLPAAFCSAKQVLTVENAPMLERRKTVVQTCDGCPKAEAWPKLALRHLQDPASNHYAQIRHRHPVTASCVLACRSNTG